MFKTPLIAGCALACAFALSGCASPGLPDLSAAASAAKTSASDPVAAQARIDGLKEVNRHIELCHRTYTLGWPFSGIVDCPAQNQAGAVSGSNITATDVANMIGAALAKFQATAAANGGSATGPAVPK